MQSVRPATRPISVTILALMGILALGPLPSSEGLPTSQPVNASPVDGGQAANPVTFRWSAPLPLPTSRYTVVAVSHGSGQLRLCEGTAALSCVARIQPAGSFVSWQVVANDGTPSVPPLLPAPVSAATTFYLPNHAPEVRVLWPSDGATEQEVYLALGWDVDERDGEPVTHRVWIGPSSGAMSQLCETSQRYCQASGLKGDTQYSWRVDADDGHGTVTGPEWRFHTRNHAPNSGWPVKPAHGARVSSPVTFEWSPGSDNDGDPVTHEVWAKPFTSPEWKLKCGPTSGTSCTVPLYPDYGFWSWRLITRDDAGHGVWSNSNDFEILRP